MIGQLGQTMLLSINVTVSGTQPSRLSVLNQAAGRSILCTVFVTAAVQPAADIASKLTVGVKGRTYTSYWLSPPCTRLNVAGLPVTVTVSAAGPGVTMVGPGVAQVQVKVVAFG